VAEEFVDNDISATKGKLRPGYQKMLAAIKAGQVGAVAVWDLDRLTRRPIELEQFVLICEASGLQDLALISGDVDLASGNGLMFARIKGAVAAEEVRKMGERIRRSHLQLAENGAYHGGRRAFGYEPGGLVIRESEAVLLREAANAVLEGGTISGIRRSWIESGIPTVTGKPWTLQVIRKSLQAPRIAGLRQHRGEVIGKAEWPEIIGETQWRQVCAILQDPSRTPKIQHRAFPLRGVLRCGECGKLLTSGFKRVKCYQCRTQTGGCGRVFIRADLAESWIEERLVPYADDPRMRNALAEASGVEIERIRQLVAENASDEARLAEASEAYAAGEITLAFAAQTSKLLEKKIAERNSQMAVMRGQSALDRFGGSVVGAWNTLTADDQRAVVLGLVESVKVDSGKGSGPRFRPERMRPVWRSVYNLDGMKITLRPDLPAELPKEIPEFIGAS
jgi:DNA invertase Pin-like site-specific DNA recombinase